MESASQASNAQKDSTQAEVPAEQPPQPQPQPQIDIYEQSKSLNDDEKNICPEKISEFVASIYTRGLLYKLKDHGAKHLPLALYPSPIPKNLFEKIFFYQIAFNKILNKLSIDQPYLEKVLEPIASKNNFIQKLLEISKKLVTFEKKQEYNKLKIAEIDKIQSSINDAQPMNYQIEVVMKYINKKNL